MFIPVLFVAALWLFMIAGLGHLDALHGLGVGEGDADEGLPGHAAEAGLLVEL